MLNKKIGKRGLMSQKARKLISKYCEYNNINSCENCGSTFGIAPAHKENRRFYSSAEELANPNNWICLCVQCHMVIESNKEKTEELFNRLRPNGE